MLPTGLCPAAGYGTYYQMSHSGGSVIYSPKGELLASVPDNEEGTATAPLDLSALREFRQRFPAWKDAECFQINI